MSATLTIPLASPLEFEGGTIAQLDLREPSGREMLAAEARIAAGVSPEAFTSYQVALVAGVTGIAEDAVDLLPASVLRRAYQFLQAFDGIRPEPVKDDVATLSIPIPGEMKVGGVTYAALNLREPTVGEQRRAETRLRPDSNPETRRGYQMVLVSGASGVPFNVVELLPVSVLNAAELFLRGFIDGGRTTGSA